MEAGILKAAIASIGEELKILKAQITGTGEQVKKKFSSLKGLWKDKAHFSLEEIKNVEIKLKGIS